ncbi:hypothetical protein BJY52DRAFT_1226755 [Lactarius psammicola]|nr:hypothetical protein BJY52DRAFT_1226755 [Lactarius psammicola]
MPATLVRCVGGGDVLSGSADAGVCAGGKMMLQMNELRGGCRGVAARYLNVKTPGTARDAYFTTLSQDIVVREQGEFSACACIGCVSGQWVKRDTVFWSYGECPRSTSRFVKTRWSLGFGRHIIRAKGRVTLGVVPDTTTSEWFRQFLFCTATVAERFIIDMGLEIATKALLDAGITNVNNNCSMWSAVLVRAAALVRKGNACALALGFNRSACLAQLETWATGAPHLWSRGSGVFQEVWGRMEHLAKIVMKNHKPSVNNPYVQFQAWYDEAANPACPQISNELTKYMCDPTSVAFTNEAFVHDSKLENQSMKLVAMGLPTDCPEAFLGCSAMDTVGYRRKRRLAEKIFAEAGASRDDVGVVELHNYFAASEYRGKYVVNPSGGLEAKGHPIGDTGLAMHFSMTSFSQDLSGIVCAEVQQESGLCMLQGYSTHPPRRGCIALCTTSGSAVQLSSAPSVAQNFTTPIDGRNRCRQGQVQIVLGRAIATRKVVRVVVSFSESAFMLLLLHALPVPHCMVMSYCP